jgi:hypothetical protein
MTLKTKKQWLKEGRYISPSTTPAEEGDGVELFHIDQTRIKKKIKSNGKVKNGGSTNISSLNEVLQRIKIKHSGEF